MKTTLALLLLVGLIALSAVPPSEADGHSDHRGNCPGFYGGPGKCYGNKEIKCRDDSECERDKKCCDVSKCLRKCVKAERPGDDNDDHGHDHHDDHNDHHDDHNDHHGNGDDCPRRHPENCYRMDVKCRDSKGCRHGEICCNLPTCRRDCIRRDKLGGYHH